MHKLTALLILASMTGCVVYTDDVYYEDPAPARTFNAPPTVADVAAGVYWDDWYFDDVWYFDAIVDDADGPYDVVSVYADVYDEWSGGQLVESFELYPTDDPYTWSSEWLGRSTYLDPYYRGYTVDIVAYDSYDASSVATVWAATY